MIVVVAALKGGVGKTTTSVYLAAVAAASRRPVTLIDADAQASAAEWIEQAEGEPLEEVSVVEAPTGRLLTRALERIEPDEIGIVDSPPGNERMLENAMSAADCVVVPTRVGGVETARAEAVFDMVPRKTPAGLVICSARTYTRDYQDAIAAWREAEIPVWGSIPERVTIAAGPEGWLATDGLDSYRTVWRRAAAVGSRLTEEHAHGPDQDRLARLGARRPGRRLRPDPPTRVRRGTRPRDCSTGRSSSSSTVSTASPTGRPRTRPTASGTSSTRAASPSPGRTAPTTRSPSDRSPTSSRCR